MAIAGIIEYNPGEVIKEMLMGNVKNVTLNGSGDAILALDQAALPNEVRVVTLSTQKQLFDAIQSLVIRGAPCIGIAAGYGYYLAARELAGEPDFFERLRAAKEYLASSRPTAVNLFWALERMERAAEANAALPRGELVARLRAEAEAIRAEDVAANLRISENGLALLKPGDGVLTHCNAGWIATSEYGTALGPLILGQQRGYNLRVYADETRPLLQGARLTSFELMDAGVDVTLICDNMAASLMKRGDIQAVFLGCDRAARNGDAANKIGTLGVAVMAHHYGIPFYMFAPTSTVDMSCPDGAHIPVEQRPGSEITTLWYEKPMAPEGVKTYNPAFDVTDHGLISGIVTEYGVVSAPFEASFERVMAEKKKQLGS